MSGLDLRLVASDEAVRAWLDRGEAPGYRPELPEAPGLLRVPGRARADVLAALAPALDAGAAAPAPPAWPPPSLGAPPARAAALMDVAELVARGWPAPLEPPPSPAELEALLGYRRALAALREAPGPDPRRVPAYKLSPGWVVSAAEAALLTAALGAASPHSAHEALLERLTAYTGVAAALGGFRVG